MEIDTITFIDKNNKSYNSYTDFGFLIKSVQISEAPIQDESLKVPGTSKILDFSETLSGKVNYDRRTITIELNKRADKEYLLEYSDIQNFLHGQLMKIVISNDPNYYWLGKVKIGNKEFFQKVDDLTIICDVDPYKYDIAASDEEWLWDDFSFDYGIINETNELEVEDELEVSIIGGKMTVCPIITCSDNMELQFKEQTFQLLEGTQEVLDVEIIEGENTLKFIGNGTVTISYRGGSL